MTSSLHAAQQITDLIGKTPLVHLKTLSRPGVDIYAKLEGQNPGGSVKDRAARRMIEGALERGDLPPGAALPPVRALAEQLGVNRNTAVAAYRDLFGRVMIETGWGRIGTRGRELVRSFADEGEAHAYVRALLARRGRAPRRIGVAYKATASISRHVDMVVGPDRRYDTVGA